MAKIEMTPSYKARQRLHVQELRERAKRERSPGTKAERKLQRELNKSPRRFRRKKVWGGELYDLWNSVLRVGVQIHPGGTELGAEFKGKATLILHFGEGEVLEEVETVAQIVLGACASQDALVRVWRERGGGSG